MMTNGRPVCNFGLALNRNYKDAEGNRKEETTFVEIECFGPRAEALARFFTKGRAIFVEGRLKLDQWESKEGEKRSALRVVLDNFEFVDSKQESNADSREDFKPKSVVSPATADTPTANSSSDDSDSDPDLDEDVPF